MIRVEPAAATLLEKIMNVVIGSQDVFINEFMNWPRNKTFPEKESTSLMNKMLSFAHFSAYMNLRRKRKSDASSATVEGMLDLMIHSGFDSEIRTDYQDCISEFGHHSLSNSKIECVQRTSEWIVRINRRCYHRRQELVSFFLDKFWDRISDLVDELFQN